MWGPAAVSCQAVRALIQVTLAHLVSGFGDVCFFFQGWLFVCFHFHFPASGSGLSLLQ